MPNPGDVAFEGRTQITTGNTTEAKAKRTYEQLKAGVNPNSSYPHVTAFRAATAAEPERAEHLTCSRVVTQDSTHIYHQRFHQDNIPGAAALHDRFFAVERTTGVISTATVALNPNIHQPQNATAPVRNTPLNMEVNSRLLFSPNAENGDPPLSPRSRHRTVGDAGF